MRYNDWRQVDLPPVGRFEPVLPVSVIVPCFEAPAALALTLAGLEGQSYPRDLFEVVIVDDGSRCPLSVPDSTPLDVRVVRQERCGFGLARARNTGARTAAHGILVFLDSDIVAEAELLEAHARWHHAVSDALTLGFCACVSVEGVDAEAVRRRCGSLRELFAGRPFDPPWAERHMAHTGELTARRDDLFRAVTGNNFGMTKAFYDEAGGCDESFSRYGGEDTEFGYRVQVRGGLLVPVRNALGWHQGRWAQGRARKERDQDLQSAKLAHLIPDPGFRPVSPGRNFAVPRHVVSLAAGDAPAGRVVAYAEALLGDPAGDLALRIELPPGRGVRDLAWLGDHFGPDPRVRFAPEVAALDEFPASPVHIALPAGAVLHGGVVRALSAALGDAAVATAVLGDGSRACVARAWALRRARGAAPAPFAPAASARAWRDPALGVEFAALGERARAVFQASSRVAQDLDGRHVDVAIADTPAEAAGVRTPVVVLSREPALSVPAFDPTLCNPVGWVREVERRVAALGPRHLLPPGVKAHRAVTAADRNALAHCHHVEDVRAFHASPAERAGTLVRLAAYGVPVHLADRDPALEELLGSELHGLMAAGPAGMFDPALDGLPVAERTEDDGDRALGGRLEWREHGQRLAASALAARRVASRGGR